MFQRPSYLNRLIKFKDSDFIKIITDVRRSGKSVLLKLYVDYLKNENIIYINFEEFEYQMIKLEEDFRKLILEKLLGIRTEYTTCLMKFSLSKVLKNEKVNTSNHTVNRYLDLLENAYLFYRVRQYEESQLIQSLKSKIIPTPQSKLIATPNQN